MRQARILGLTVEPRKRPVLLICLFFVSDPDIHGRRKITSVDGIPWYNGEEHMGQIMQLPVAIKMKMDVLFVVFRKNVPRYAFVCYFNDCRENFSSWCEVFTRFQLHLYAVL